jgi:hypothetical protein
MIREAETKDRDAIQLLYEILCPDEQINVLSERIEQIRNDSHNFLYVYDSYGLSNSFRLDAHRFFEANGYNGIVSKGFKKYL